MFDTHLFAKNTIGGGPRLRGDDSMITRTAVLFFLLTTRALAGDLLPRDLASFHTAREKLRHCIPIYFANTLAMKVASDLTYEMRFGKDASTSLTVPLYSDWVLHKVGGADEIDRLRKQAFDWEESWQSLGRTYWFPLQLDDGSSPYVVSEGEVLLNCFLDCLSIASALSNVHGPLYAGYEEADLEALR